MASLLSRVTIVAPRGRVDVALPADVPLVDLLPTLLEASGGAAENPGRRGGWVLSRMNGDEFDNSRTPAQLSVRDGELLYLRPRGEAGPLMVFDDLVDALASGTRDRRGRWVPQTTRLAGRIAAILAVAGGAVALPFAGPPYLFVGVTGLALTVILLVVAMVFTRALGEAWTGTAFALVATVYAGVGGLFLLAGDRSASQLTLAHVAVAVTAAVIAAVLASAGVPTAAPIFLSAGVCAVAVFAALGISAAMGRGVAAGASITVALAYAILPVMPMLAYRFAGLPRPSVPTDREHLRQENETVDAARVLHLGQRADFFLSSMLGTLSIVSAAAAVLVVSAGGRGLAMAGVLVLLPILRSRWFRGRTQRIPLLITGGTALTAVAVTLFVQAGQVQRLLAVLGVALVVAAASIGFGLAGQRPQSPPWTRFLDIVETVLILALLPLAAWVSGVLDAVRAIRG
ncbi:type VII secretion integral membrane protein EccD [Rugosimonospora acidiphila]|uniref:Type VII secretion integral membrane protein EccD n=1 Tax=Rugosimonospora acidiphila TaxID=556531 RepID=A0ABP9RSI4_9ACTN